MSLCQCQRLRGIGIDNLEHHFNVAVMNTRVVVLASALVGTAVGVIATRIFEDRRGSQLSTSIPADSDAFWHTLPLSVGALLVARCYLLASSDQTLRRAGGWIGVTASIFTAALIHWFAVVPAIVLLAVAYRPQRQA
jgi:hypothetical protein